MMKIESYSIERIEPDNSYAIWLQLEPNILTPLVYLRQPKKFSNEQWDKIVKRVRLDVEPGFYEEIMEISDD